MMNRGFTIIEILISAALVAIIGVGIGALSYFYFQSSKSFTSDILYTSVELKHRAALRDMGEAIRSSKGVLATTLINTTTYNTATTTFILNMFSLDTNGNPIAGDDKIVYDFNNSTKTIKKIVSPGIGSYRRPENSLLTDVTHSVTFTFDNSEFSLVKKITIALISKKTAGNASTTITDTVNFTLR